MGFTGLYKVFGFDCCGECSTKTKVSNFGWRLFCCVCHCLTSEQDGTGLEQQRSRLQRRRAPPAAEAARSCWGRGQRYASKAQRMLGAATRLPAAETGRRGWGRVLIFQGPVKGLRKNQQTQLVRAAHLSDSFCRNVYQESSACRSTICTASVGRDRTGTMYVRAIRKKQRQGITMTVVPCLLLFTWYRGVLSVCGMV